MTTRKQLISAGSRAFQVGWLSLATLFVIFIVSFVGLPTSELTLWISLLYGIIVFSVGKFFGRKVAKDVLIECSDPFGHSFLGLILSVISAVVLIGTISFLFGKFRLTAEPASVRFLPSVFSLSIVSVLVSVFPILFICWPLSRYFLRLRNEV